jgi:hypothetical protein
VDLSLAHASAQIRVVLPLTVGRFRVFEPGLKCSVAELTLCRTFQTALAHSKAPDHERDHRSGGASALHRHNVKASKWSTSRRRRRWRRARRWSAWRRCARQPSAATAPCHHTTVRVGASEGCALCHDFLFRAKLRDRTPAARGPCTLLVILWGGATYSILIYDRTDTHSHATSRPMPDISPGPPRGTARASMRSHSARRPRSPPLPALPQSVCTARPPGLSRVLRRARDAQCF